MVSKPLLEALIHRTIPEAKSVEKNYVFSKEITDAICRSIVFESID
jgi:hypothetical protein